MPQYSDKAFKWYIWCLKMLRQLLNNKKTEQIGRKKRMARTISPVKRAKDTTCSPAILEKHFLNRWYFKSMYEDHRKKAFTFGLVSLKLAPRKGWWLVELWHSWEISIIMDFKYAILPHSFSLRPRTCNILFYLTSVIKTELPPFFREISFNSFTIKSVHEAYHKWE